MLIAGDIGGTKTDLAIVSPTAGPRAPVAAATFPSAHAPDLASLVRTFLAGVTVPVDRAVFAVAGPVIDGRARITNLPWVVDAEHLQQALNVSSVRLLNDLEAMAEAVPLLQPTDLHPLNAGAVAAGGAVALVAPGTGLGEAFLTWDGARYRPHPSEGGHADFAPTDLVQLGLLSYLRQRLDHVSIERVCSGSGIPTLYAYLRDRGAAAESPALAAHLAAAADRTPLIVAAALDLTAPDPLCATTIELFVDILGAEAGNLALKVLATGGVYVGGGIPPRILPALTDGRFRHAFTRKGRFADLLARVPVHVITNPRVALLGAASAGLAAA